jgi:ABC-type transporter Mla subunit MlaD
VKTLADNRGDITGVVTNLAAFTDTLARNDAKIRTLTGTLADATQYLASERTALAEALKNLAVALGEIADLVRGHRAELGSDIQSLAKITQVVVKHRDSLIEALEVLPLGVANIASSVNTDAKTLDIRNNNHQGDNGYSIAFCQIVFPILNKPCPPEPAARTRSARPSTPAQLRAARDTAAAERLTDRLSPLSFFASAS